MVMVYDKGVGPVGTLVGTYVGNLAFSDFRLTVVGR